MAQNDMGLFAEDVDYERKADFASSSNVLT
jgi:hypothetical protein